VKLARFLCFSIVLNTYSVVTDGLFVRLWHLNKESCIHCELDLSLLHRLGGQYPHRGSSDGHVVCRFRYEHH
jgi:hypothetical protein